MSASPARRLTRRRWGSPTATAVVVLPLGVVDLVGVLLLRATAASAAGRLEEAAQGLLDGALLRATRLLVAIRLEAGLLTAALVGHGNHHAFVPCGSPHPYLIPVGTRLILIIQYICGGVN